VATIQAIHSVGASLVRYLESTYPPALRTRLPCQFSLLSSGELSGAQERGTTVSLFCHRITTNQDLRNTPAAHAARDGLPPLALDLHFLLTIWADNAVAELTLMGWSARQLYLHQTLTQSDLNPDGGWGADDHIQIIPAEMTSEDMMRIWDALDPPYRLSTSYVARVIRIDPDDSPTGRAVVARRLRYSDEGGGSDA
jgi:hypothetical protein